MRGPRLRYVSRDGGRFASYVELLDEDNPSGESFHFTTPMFDGSYACFPSGRTVYRAEKDGRAQRRFVWSQRTSGATAVACATSQSAKSARWILPRGISGKPAMTPRIFSSSARG